MIDVTRLDRGGDLPPYSINPDLIERIDENLDTTLLRVHAHGLGGGAEDLSASSQAFDPAGPNGCRAGVRKHSLPVPQRSGVLNPLRGRFPGKFVDNR